MQKVSGRFLPTVKHSGRQPDNEASKQEFINEKGAIVDPSQVDLADPANRDRSEN
jgi:hypothetical protein